MKKAILMALGLMLGVQLHGESLRVGIIGLDTSHVVAFAKMLNADAPAPEFQGCRVTVAYPGGSPDIEASISRVEGFTKTLREQYGVEIVDSIAAMLERCDVVCLESLDGRPHLEQLLPVLKAGKRVFVDKPVAGSLTDAVLIYQAAEKYKVPLFCSSSLRFTEKMAELRSGKHGPVIGAQCYSPCSIEPTHPDLYWYGIHGVEPLFTMMGTGCEQVVRVSTPGTDVAVGTWQGGRIGVFRGNRESASRYGAEAFMKKGTQVIDDFKGYNMMLAEIVKFFKGGPVPVSPAETLEIYAFMTAADVSKERGGVPVTIKEVMDKARAEAAKRQL